MSIPTTTPPTSSDSSPGSPISFNDLNAFESPQRSRTTSPDFGDRPTTPATAYLNKKGLSETDESFTPMRLMLKEFEYITTGTFSKKLETAENIGYELGVRTAEQKSAAREQCYLSVITELEQNSNAPSDSETTSALTKQITLLKQQISSLSEELELTSSQKPRSASPELRKEISELQDDLKEKTAALTEKEETLSALEQELSSEKTKLADAIKTNQTRIEDLTKNLDSLNKKLKDNTSITEALNQQLTQLKQAHSDCPDELLSKTTELTAAEQQNSRLQQELIAAQQTNSNLQSQLTEASTALTQAKTTQATLTKAALAAGTVAAAAVANTFFSLMQ